MNERVAVRIAELACGGFALWLHAHYGIDSLLLVLVCVLWGIPLDIVLNSLQKEKKK